MVFHILHIYNQNRPRLAFFFLVAQSEEHRSPLFLGSFLFLFPGATGRGETLVTRLVVASIPAEVEDFFLASCSLPFPC